MQIDADPAAPTQFWPDAWTWQSYIDAWETAPLANWLANTLVLVVLGLFGQTFVSIFVAFGSRERSSGRNQLFMLVLATLMLPYHVTVVPWFIMFRSAALLDNLWRIALPDLWGMPSTSLSCGSFSDRTGGPGRSGRDRRRQPAPGTVSRRDPALQTCNRHRAVFNLIHKWDQFFWPFAFIQTPEKLTLAVGLRWFRTQYAAEYPMLMAASVVSVAPVVIVSSSHRSTSRAALA